MEVPHKAREMHASIYSKEVATLPMELNFLLASIQNEASALGSESLPMAAETSSFQPLLASVEQKFLIIKNAMEEQTIARTLLLRFGLPYLPGAEEVWLTLSEYLTDAKAATEQAQLQLNQAIGQIKALLISQLKTEQESELEALEMEEKQHRLGITTLQKTSGNLVGENELIAQKDGAIDQKKARLTVITIEKRKVRDYIQAMRTVVSNMISSFTDIDHFDKTQLVMA